MRLSDLGLDHRDRVDYIPSGWSDLRRALEKPEVSDEDVFLDVGAGLGRVVCQAARRYRFRRVIGVEISAELAAVARSNVRRSASRFRCQDVSLVTADATTYRIPDDVTVIYLFNPFKGPLFGRVVDEITQSLRRAPRTIRIVYANPIEHAQLEAAGATLLRDIRPRRLTRRWAPRNPIRVYAITPTQHGQTGSQPPSPS